MDPSEAQQRQMQSLAPGEEHPHAAVFAGNEQLKSSFAEKDLEVLVGNEFNKSQQCDFASKKTNSFPGLH